LIVDRWVGSAKRYHAVAPFVVAGSLVAGLLAGWGIGELGKPPFAAPVAGPRTYSMSRSAGDELWRPGSGPWLRSPSRDEGEGRRVKRRDEPSKEPRRGRAQARAAVDDSRELEDVVASEPTQASASSPARSIQRPSTASGDRKRDSGGDGNTDGSGASDADGADGGGTDAAEDDSGGIVGGGGGGG
jgi:hypothetical protein